MEMGQLEQSVQNRQAFDHWKIVGPTARILSFLIDGILVGLSLLAFVLLFSPNIETSHLSFLWILSMWLWDGLWLMASGTTPGKRILGISVYSPRHDGIPSPLQVCVRVLTFWMSVLLLGIGLTPILFRKDRRGWHDLLSETLTVGQKKSLPTTASQNIGQVVLMAQALVVFSFGGALLLSVGVGQLHIAAKPGRINTCDSRDVILNQTPEASFAVAVSPAWHSCVPKMMSSLGALADSQLARIVELSSRYFEMWNQDVQRRSEYYEQAVQSLEFEVCRGSKSSTEICRTARHMASVSVPNVDTANQISWLNKYEPIAKSISLEADSSRRIASIQQALQTVEEPIVRSALRDRMWAEELASGQRPSDKQPTSMNAEWNAQQVCWLEAFGYEDFSGCRNLELKEGVTALYLMIETKDSEEAKDRISRLELGEAEEEFRLLVTAFELKQTGNHEEMKTLLTALRSTSPLQRIARQLNQ